MRRLGQKLKWVIDAVLFLGFLVAMALDLTGLPVHQWLGIGVAALAGYHLLVHRDWVASVTRRFFANAGTRARLLYGVDAALLLGFAAITVTGLALSTWLDLPLQSYDTWRVAHVAVSVGTLWLVVVKVALHWRWIAGVARRHLIPAFTAPRRGDAQPAAAVVSLGRRHFVGLTGGVAALAALNSIRVLRGIAGTKAGNVAVAQELPTASVAQPTPTRGETDVLAAATTTSSATTAAPSPDTTVPEQTASDAVVVTATAAAPTPTATAAPIAACTVRCPRGCSYPGSCRKYTDSNGNGLCDLGECL